jgi:hypothetical protein
MATVKKRTKKSSSKTRKPTKLIRAKKSSKSKKRTKTR